MGNQLNKFKQNQSENEMDYQSMDESQNVALHAYPKIERLNSQPQQVIIEHKNNKKSFFSKFKIESCTPNFNCLQSQKMKGQSQWQRHIRYLAQVECKKYGWSNYIFQSVVKPQNTQIDQLNQKSLLQVAIMSKLEAEENVAQGLSEQEIDSFINQLIENTEILPEILQEYRYVPKSQNKMQESAVQRMELRKKNISIYKNAYQYKATIKYLEDQICDVKHPLFLIREKFIEYFISQKKSSINGQNSNDNNNNEVTDIIDEIKAFINFYIETMRVYYLLDDISVNNNPSGSDLESFINIENITNFVTSVLFQHENFFHMVFKYCQNTQSKLQFNYSKNLKLLQSSSPKTFNIEDEFCLNENTLKYINNKRGNNNSYNISDFDKKKILQPYQKSLNILNKLKNTKEPVKMLKVLIDTSESIKDCIEEFYMIENNNNKNNNNNINLLDDEQKTDQKFQLLAKCYDGDHFLSIFLYFIVSTQMEQLFVYLQLIQEFVFRNTSNSVSGYLLITLEGCVHHISQYYDKK